VAVHKLGLLTLLWPITGCWSPEGGVLPEGPVAFAPEAAEIQGWAIQRWAMTEPTCPRGEVPYAYLAYPVTEGPPLPVAVVFHPGAFDYVTEPDPGDPLAGDHLQDPSRLDRDWAARGAFAFLGMADDSDPYTADAGALAAALAEQEIAMLLVTNCWGDLWHNETTADAEELTGRENDLEEDGFERNGFAAARLAWRLVADPEFASTQGFAPPISVDQGKLFMVGLGYGGRAVGELIGEGFTPAAAAVDSLPDDLRAYWDGDADLYGPTVIGLERVFPDGRDSVVEGSLATATLPARTAYLYSALDPMIPATAHANAISAVGALADGWVLDTALPSHVATAGDLPTARLLAAWLLDTEPVGGDTGDTGSR
jgi:hypothetical protein